MPMKILAHHLTAGQGKCLPGREIPAAKQTIIMKYLMVKNESPGFTHR
jgi:hypothetical protein